MTTLPSDMRALTISHPLSPTFSNLSFTRLALPSAPTGTQVLIHVRAVSLNARDAQIASGTYPAPIQVREGIVAGSDAAGDVVAVGEAVSRVTVGDRVTPIFAQTFLHGEHDPDYQKQGLGGGIDGVLRDYFLCDESGVVLIPSHLTYTEACCSVITGVTAWHCFSYPGCALKTGETVLVLGTGGVSIYAAQLALASGCRVIVTSSSDAKLSRARRELGVHGTVNYRTHRDWDVKVRELTGGRGVDHVIEVGGKGTLVRSIRSCRPLGNVWVVGYMSDYAAGKVEGQDDNSEAPELAKEILYAQARVHGVVCGSRDMFEDMNRCVEANRIVPVVDKVFPWDEAREAYRYLDSGAHFGKVVIEL
ncbi:NAD(P)-binding protein [Rhodotorula diobovata]|uniref:NAD(P)-binding protein n=1 Tax=Rhodotorula diobovata TaxID=5288 RepID=A0A5C5FMM7_9BASI|nr:NAD(P)-binding protein [Rhodotorula diobovata]